MGQYQKIREVVCQECGTAIDQEIVQVGVPDGSDADLSMARDSSWERIGDVPAVVPEGRDPEDIPETLDGASQAVLAEDPAALEEVETGFPEVPEPIAQEDVVVAAEDRPEPEPTNDETVVPMDPEPAEEAAPEPVPDPEPAPAEEPAPDPEPAPADPAEEPDLPDFSEDVPPSDPPA